MRLSLLLIFLAGCDFAYFPTCQFNCNMAGSDKIFGATTTTAQSQTQQQGNE